MPTQKPLPLRLPKALLPPMQALSAPRSQRRRRTTTNPRSVKCTCLWGEARLIWQALTHVTYVCTQQRVHVRKQRPEDFSTLQLPRRRGVLCTQDNLCFDCIVHVRTVRVKLISFYANTAECWCLLCLCSPCPCSQTGDLELNFNSCHLILCRIVVVIIASWLDWHASCTRPCHIERLEATRTRYVCSRRWSGAMPVRMSHARM